MMIFLGNMDKNLNNSQAVQELLVGIGVATNNWYKQPFLDGYEYFCIHGYLKNGLKAIELNATSIKVTSNGVNYQKVASYFKCIAVENFDSWNYDQHWEDAQFYSIDNAGDLQEYRDFYLKKFKAAFSNIVDVDWREVYNVQHLLDIVVNIKP